MARLPPFKGFRSLRDHPLWDDAQQQMFADWPSGFDDTTFWGPEFGFDSLPEWAQQRRSAAGRGGAGAGAGPSEARRPGSGVSEHDEDAADPEQQQQQPRECGRHSPFPPDFGPSLWARRAASSPQPPGRPMTPDEDPMVTRSRSPAHGPLHSRLHDGAQHKLHPSSFPSLRRSDAWPDEVGGRGPAAAASKGARGSSPMETDVGAGAAGSCGRAAERVVPIRVLGRRQASPPVARSLVGAAGGRNVAGESMETEGVDVPAGRAQAAEKTDGGDGGGDGDDGGDNRERGARWAVDAMHLARQPQAHTALHSKVRAQPAEDAEGAVDGCPADGVAQPEVGMRVEAVAPIPLPPPQQPKRQQQPAPSSDVGTGRREATPPPLPPPPPPLPQAWLVPGPAAGAQAPPSMTPAAKAAPVGKATPAGASAAKVASAVKAAAAAKVATPAPGVASVPQAGLPPPEQVASKQRVPEYAVPEQMPPQRMPEQQMPEQQMPQQQMPQQQMAQQKMPQQKMPQQMPQQQMPQQQMPEQKMPQQKMPPQRMPEQQMPQQQMPQQQMPQQKMPEQQMPQQQMPQQMPEQQMPQQKMPEQKIPQQMMAEQKIPQQKMPQQMPEQKMPQQKMPENKIPQQMPEQKMSQQKVPQQKMPQQKTTENKMPQQMPAQKTPQQKMPQQNAPEEIAAEQKLPEPKMPEHPGLRRIAEVEAAAQRLERDVEAFSGRRGERSFLLLEELLTKELLRLDSVEPAGDEVVRRARKEGVRRVQRALDALERRAAAAESPGGAGGRSAENGEVEMAVAGAGAVTAERSPRGESCGVALEAAGSAGAAAAEPMDVWCAGGGGSEHDDYSMRISNVDLDEGGGTGSSAQARAGTASHGAV
ncbi:uncharacterized protein LOC144931574 isoform X1 [Lampetra fluviatilis]